MTVVKTPLLIVTVICFVMVVMLAPIETSVVPQWSLQVVDVNGTACPNMRVTQGWGHYRIYLDGNNSSDNRLTDLNGYVHFPERRIRASLSRRLIMPIVTRIATAMHGGWDVDGAVWASGIKDVAWLNYKSSKSLPDKMRVEKCISDGTEQALAAASPVAFIVSCVGEPLKRSAAEPQPNKTRTHAPQPKQTRERSRLLTRCIPLKDGSH